MTIRFFIALQPQLMSKGAHFFGNSNTFLSKGVQKTSDIGHSFHVLSTAVELLESCNVNVPMSLCTPTSSLLPNCSFRQGMLCSVVSIRYFEDHQGWKKFQMEFSITAYVGGKEKREKKTTGNLSEFICPWYLLPHVK